MNIDAIEMLKCKAVVVIGDVMLDRYVYGQVNRISPEAPIPVLRFQKEKAMLGGAGNVARNVAALQGRAILVAAAGHDEDGSHVAETLCSAAGIEARVIRSDKYVTTVKTRFVCAGHQMLRVDREDTALDDETLGKLHFAADEAMSHADAVVLSDYAKGVLTATSIRTHIDSARAAGVPVIVDPKSRDLSLYRSADVITPNAEEAATATGHDCSTDAGAGLAARAILEVGDFGAVLITRGGQGMTLLAPSRGIVEPLHLSTQASAVYDVSGAGDTVVATLALAIAAGVNIEVASELANAAAGIVVGKLGTATVTAEELARSFSGPEARSAANRNETAEQVRQWQTEGLTVGFTNGCFDLIHPGHISLLNKARQQCDRLVVALNTDDSVKRLKGESRPIQDQYSRAAVISSLRAVDLVTFFDEDTPLELITLLGPDILFKGGDYLPNEVVGKDVIESRGGRVCLIAVEQGHSTTSIINRSGRAVVDRGAAPFMS